MDKTTSHGTRDHRFYGVRGKAGALIFVVMVAAYGFLLVSPYVPNYFGQALEDDCLVDAEARIRQIRTGPVRIHLSYAGNGSNCSGANVDYDLVQHAFNFGAMFFHYDLSEPTNDVYAGLWKDVFNHAVLPFYYTSWDTPDTYPEEVRINDTIRYCEQNNITLKGHCLMWNYEAGIPNWLDPIENHTSEEIVADFQARITELVGKYQDNITTWDVTNEVVHRGVFHDLDPVEFTKQCFVWARSANSQATLVFNDYAMLGHEFGCGDVSTFCETLTQCGTPYDAIGMQGHAMDTDWVPMYEALATLDGFTRLGKRIHITEVMVPSTPVPITNSWKKGLWSEENQAEYLRRLYTLCFSHPSVEEINYWGFEEGHRGDGYGLVNHDLSPKQSYNMLKNLIHNTWNTSGSMTADSGGWIDFSGFYGTYNVTVNGNTVQIVSSPGENNEFHVMV